MEGPLFKERGARRRGLFSVFALFSVIFLSLLAVSAFSNKQDPRKFAVTLEELDGIDLDNVDEAAAFLKSKVRASPGDEYLYASSPYSEFVYEPGHISDAYSRVAE